MKTASDVLQALSLPKNSYNMAHCGKIAAIYKVLESEKRDITSVSVEQKEFWFGKVDDKKNRINWDGEKTAGQSITVITSRGKYSVTIPDKSKVYAAFCDLLGIQYEQEASQKKVKESFAFPATAIKAIQKALSFTSKDELRPVMQCISLEISNRKLQVVGTDAHQLYMSELFEINHEGEYQFLIQSSQFKNKKFPKKFGEESFQFELLEADKVCMLGWELDLFTGVKFVGWKNVVPQYSQSITFNREDFISTVKQTMVYANKSTHQVNLCMNGSIEFIAQDIDFSFESTNRMNYIRKDMPDMSIGFNGRMLIRGLGELEADELQMFSGGNPNKAAIFTDGRDSVLVMPLMLNETYNPETYKRMEEEEQREPGETIGKEIRIYSSYLDWLLTVENKITTFVHRYEDRLSIRYVRMVGGKVIRGQRIIELTEDRKTFLVPAIEKLMAKFGAEIIKK